MQPANPDRVSPPVITRSTILALLGLLAAFGVDLSTDQASTLADAALIVLPLAGSLAGAIWGAMRARRNVTPVLPGDTPRDLHGNVLAPTTHSPSTGYPPPERYVRPEDRPRRNLVDPP